MTRIQTHTIDDAPEPARPLLAGVVKTSPTGKLLNLHAQMAHSFGQVSEMSWHRATASGWDSEQLTEAFSYLALTVFTGYFLNYAQTPLDLPSGSAGQE